MPDGGYKEGASPIADALHQLTTLLDPGPPAWKQVRTFQPPGSSGPPNVLWARPRFLLSPIDVLHLKVAILAGISIGPALSGLLNKL